MRVMTVVLGVFALWAACKNESSSGGGALSKSAMISAATGGVVALGNGTALEIPAGALAADTQITMTEASAGLRRANGVLAAVELKPDGLKLSKPAKLTIRYTGDSSFSADDLAIVVLSGANPQKRSSGEVNPFAEVPATAVTDGSTALTAMIEHFSWYSISFFPRLHFAPIFSAKHLRPGDILYALTNAITLRDATAMPMHVGLFVGTGPANENVIESTLPSSDCTPEFLEGVDVHTYSDRKGFVDLCGAHLFIGARRPTADVTPAQGLAAVEAAYKDRGKPYGMIGLNVLENGGGIIAGGISCVELVERAWEGAGVNISSTPNVLLWPHDQFANTVPVTRIEVNLADGPVRIPLAVPVRTSRTQYTAGGAGRIPVTLDIDSDAPELVTSGRAQLVDSTVAQAVKDFLFTPTSEDVGKLRSFDVSIDVPAPRAGSLRRGAIQIFVNGPPDAGGGEQCLFDFGNCPCAGRAAICGQFQSRCAAGSVAACVNRASFCGAKGLCCTCVCDPNSPAGQSDCDALCKNGGAKSGTCVGPTHPALQGTGPRTTADDVGCLCVRE
jgi:hypothetical protein